MLEIIAIIALGKKIAEIARGKNLGPTMYVALMVIFWVVFEFAGAILGNIFLGEGLAAYPLALLGAGLGASIGYMLVKSAKPRIREEEI